MRIKNIIMILYIFVLIISLNAQSISEKRDHVKDAKECFGMEDNATPEAKFMMETLFNCLYKEMDQGGNSCQGLRIREIIGQIQDIDSNFNTGNYGHRLFFHDGFMTGSRYNFPNAIQLQLFKNYDKNERRRLFHKHKKELERKYEESQKKFYDYIINQFQSKYNLCHFHFTRGGDGIALIKIIYDIHILGDYIEAHNDYTKDALMPFGELKQDLKKSIEQFGYKNKDNLNKLTDRDFAKQFPNEQVQAEHILKFLKTWFPEVIKKNDKLKAAIWGV